MSLDVCTRYLCTWFALCHGCQVYLLLTSNFLSHRCRTYSCERPDIVTVQWKRRSRLYDRLQINSIECCLVLGSRCTGNGNMEGSSFSVLLCCMSRDLSAFVLSEGDDRSSRRRCFTLVVIHCCNRCANWQGIAFLSQDMHETSGERCLYLNIHLVGHDFY